MVYQPKTFRDKGGDRHNIDDGGQIRVLSGGEIDIESGGEFKAAGSVVNLSSALALVGIMTSAAAEIAHDTTSPATVAESDDTSDRNALLIVKVTETFVGDTELATMQFGEEDTVDKFLEIGHGKTIDTPEDGDIYVAAGVLTQEKDMIVTVTANDATAGEVQLFVIVLPDEDDS